MMTDILSLTESTCNPVLLTERLGVIMRAQEGEPSEVEGVLNPALARGRDGQLYLFARVVAKGNFSRIRMARVEFDAAGRPVDVERLGFALEPEASYELRGAGAGGCEDPRITFIPLLDCYVMAYAAYGPEGARVAVAISSDLFSWQRLGLVDFGEQDGVDFNQFTNKDAFFFPEPVMAPDGTLSFALMHRPMTGADQSADAPFAQLPSSIWVSYVAVAEALGNVSRLTSLRQHRLVLRPEYDWEEVKVGGGGPPLRTEQGWLLLHHGIKNLAQSGQARRLQYASGAFVVDACDVTKVLWRSPEPLLVPETEEELSGVVNDVVFPTGIDVAGAGTLDVYYGMADSRIGVARLWLHQPAMDAEMLDVA